MIKQNVHGTNAANHVGTIKVLLQILFLWYEDAGFKNIPGAGVGEQQMRAWLFNRKLQPAMKKDKEDKLSGEIHVNEIIVGGYYSY